MKRTILLLPESNRDRIYGPKLIAEVQKLVTLTDCAGMSGHLDALKPILADTELILTGWGMMKMDREFLDSTPALEAVFYGAGSVRRIVTEEFWRRNILLTSAWAANAIPVIDFTVAAIVFALKGAVSGARLTRQKGTFVKPNAIRGIYRASVGVVGAGMIGAGVLERLRSYDVATLCHDPRLPEQSVRELGARPAGLEEVFRTCDVVTLHAADILSTRHMITGAHFRSMKDGATFINTARGRIVKEGEMIEALRDGRICAFLDVTDPEAPPPGSPLYDLTNVFLTPHLAGAEGSEVRRNGEYAVEELRRFLKGQGPRYPVTRQMMEWMA
jgi:phosphoglycerate dehydrogenase-like enzyme